jgi:hypothetical protein
MRKLINTKSFWGAASIGAAAIAAAAWCQPAQAAFTALNSSNIDDAGISYDDTPINIQHNSPTEFQMYNLTESGGDIRAMFDNAVTCGATGTATVFAQLTLTNTAQGTSGNWNAGIGISSAEYCRAHSYDLFTLNANGSGTSVPLTFDAGDSTNQPGVSTGLSLQVGTTYNLWMVLNGGASETVSVYESTGSGTPGLLGTYPLTASGYEHLGNQPFAPVTVVAYANDADWVGEGNWTNSTAYNGSNTFLLDNMSIDNSGANLANPVAAVPEPATLGLLGMAGAGLLLRRRRA